MREAEIDLLLEQLSPELPGLERSVRAAEPNLEEPEVLERALQRGLDDLRRRLSIHAFDYLKARLEVSKLERSKMESMARRFTLAGARNQRDSRRAAWGLGGVDAACTASPHAFRDRDGCCWTVHEVDTSERPWGHGRHCLIFSSETAIRRVWGFPEDWAGLGEAELETLSWAI